MSDRKIIAPQNVPRTEPARPTHDDESVDDDLHVPSPAPTLSIGRDQRAGEAREKKNWRRTSPV